jgi:hypothetical protein
MYHDSIVRPSTGASPVLSPAPSSATLSTQQWPPAAVPTESAQIANGPDRGEAPQSRKRLLTSTALQILVGLCPAPLASRSDTSTPNQEGVAGSPRQEPPRESKRIKRPHAVEEAETDAVPNDASTCCDAKGADVTSLGLGPACRSAGSACVNAEAQRLQRARPCACIFCPRGSRPRHMSRCV